jgi:hypothetical protein
MWNALRASVVLAAAIALVAIGVWSAGAKSPKRKSVRKEVAELRQEVAELRAVLGVLESRVAFEARRDAVAAQTVVGGICGDPCAQDSDGDGSGDCEDLCPCDATNADGDGDGSPDCVDPCPSDATDACIDPCRTDSDGDGTSDCEDGCPWDPAPASDGDEDGVPDCQDPCPDDPSNACIGPCPLLDQDGDGILDCTDPCPYGEATGMPCVAPAQSSDVRAGGSGQFGRHGSLSGLPDRSVR